VWWSLAKILVTIVTTAYAGWMQYVIMAQVARAMAEDPSAPPQMQGVMTGVMAATIGITVIWGLAWGWALPVFLLIWFSRAGVRAEVGRWTAPHHGRVF
jgi:F0F1-type ATP synthase membrane subunit c/vacuolar-type H+-ATPase subunit K